MSHTEFPYLCSLMVVCGLAIVQGAYAATELQANAGDAHFNAMDTNRDGKLSPEEHATSAGKMFDTMDADKDDRVTSAEMDAAHEKVTVTKTTQTEMSSAEKIKVIDANGDGILTAEEHAAGSWMIFETMDTNKDGFVSKDEMAAGHAKMLKKGGQ